MAKVTQVRRVKEPGLKPRPLVWQDLVLLWFPQGQGLSPVQYPPPKQEGEQVLLSSGMCAMVVFTEDLKMSGLIRLWLRSAQGLAKQIQILAPG